MSRQRIGSVAALRKRCGSPSAQRGRNAEALRRGGSCLASLSSGITGTAPLALNIAWRWAGCARALHIALRSRKTNHLGLSR